MGCPFSAGTAALPPPPPRAGAALPNPIHTNRSALRRRRNAPWAPPYHRAPPRAGAALPNPIHTNRSALRQRRNAPWAPPYHRAPTTDASSGRTRRNFHTLPDGCCGAPSSAPCTALPLHGDSFGPGSLPNLFSAGKVPHTHCFYAPPRGPWRRLRLTTTVPR